MYRPEAEPIDNNGPENICVFPDTIDNGFHRWITLHSSGAMMGNLKIRGEIIKDASTFLLGDRCALHDMIGGYKNTSKLVVCESVEIRIVCEVSPIVITADRNILKCYEPIFLLDYPKVSAAQVLELLLAPIIAIRNTSIADEKRDYVLKIKLPHHIPAPEFAKLLKPYRVRHVDFRKGPKRYGNTFALVRFSNNHHVLFAAQRMEEEPLVSNGKKLEVSVVPAPPLPAALGFGLRSGVDPQDLDAIFRKMGTVEVIKIKQEHTFADNEWTCSSPNVTVHLRDAEQVSQATDLVKSVAEALIWVRGGKKSYVVDATTPESSTSANENIPPS
ncbi:hypothetical protein BOTBODRAFT_189678 [Botryobasidium botryosum FD-172 SS1]|uniref:Uncharacterized protein n=1 Tax=Botryobasidium botryosum (strain FD-172 SS1) TaxID=930990 RepID=A0A067MJD1_BOTB1|nr:hypothetical protein BOTBODRAFT_189678 [Botryobasidium botryosum FD-172 SS1]